MQIGPRYKRARYLGSPVFAKTQTQKYSMRSQRKSKNTKRKGMKSEYGRQMLEKQKARYSYGISSGQFTNYVKSALKTKGDNAKNLLRILESRLDNVILRTGFTPSRSAARQIVSHGHITVNNKKVTIPSFQVKIGDIISIREGSKNKTIFKNINEEINKTTPPPWIQFDAKDQKIKIASEPITDASELLFDLRSVLEFYTR